MLRQLSMLAALMMSSGLISIGHGAVGALVVQSGSNYGFSDTFIGFLTTVTYVGFVAGNYLFRWLLPRISYIRTFSVCAALLAVCALLLPLLPVKASWILMRFGHGLFFSTTVVICESWLNSMVDNQHRGKVHAAFMTINYLAYGSSQYILLLGSQRPELAFSVVAIFLVLSLAPICMTRFAEPQFAAGAGGGRMRIADAYHIAPLAYIAHIGNGLFSGATWLFVRYAEFVTDTEAAASTLAVIFFGSGFLLQLPIGWLSDRVKDRRSVMTAVYGASALFSLMLFAGEFFPAWTLPLIVLLLGMFSATVFSLTIAYGQDFAGPERAAEYAGRLFQPFAFGAMVGPFVAGAMMDALSSVWLFAFLGAVCAAVTALTLTDIVMPRFIPAKQSSYQPVASHAPTVGEELPQYNEYDIGPDPIDEAVRDEAAEGDSFVGPQAPGAAPDAPPPEFVGPTQPANRR